MQFVDANVFLRYLTRDDPDKAQACLELFRRADRGEVALFTTETIMAEIVYVLASPRLYNLSRHDIRKRLMPLLTLSGLRMPNRQAVLRALELYETHPVDFEDALAVAHMEQQGMDEIISYDRDFDRFPQATRVEP
ncbi:MAG: type II toxin-antitoxin system VapC family toxin [Chloroflexi bacterium]|nr:type II toxin-antitoxin system VapC family toxin [Chloroflexota bacterium]